VLQVVEGFVPDAVWLSERETLTYLHSCISTGAIASGLTRVADVLDASWSMSTVTGGLDPRLGKALPAHAAPVIGVSVRNPPASRQLNRPPFPTRRTRAIALEDRCSKGLTRIPASWFAKRKSIMGILRR